MNHEGIMLSGISQTEKGKISWYHLSTESSKKKSNSSNKEQIGACQVLGGRRNRERLVKGHKLPL